MPRFELWALLGLMVAAAGCGAGCDRVCIKLLDCGDEGALQTDRFSRFECEDSCQRQGNVFSGWEDESEFQTAWNEHRRCLVREDCEDIADGVCYDERFFIVGEG